MNYRGTVDESDSRQRGGSSYNCLNCGTQLTGQYCTGCGQSARVRGLSLWPLLKEFVEEIWDIDSKAWRSLLPLMFRPGYLTAGHLVFFMHFHAFGFVVLVLDIFFHELGGTFGWPNTLWRIVASITAIYMALYLLIAMRRVYEQGWLVTSVKYLLLCVTYIVGLSLSLTGVVIYTAMTL